MPLAGEVRDATTCQTLQTFYGRGEAACSESADRARERAEHNSGSSPGRRLSGHHSGQRFAAVADRWLLLTGCFSMVPSRWLLGPVRRSSVLGQVVVGTTSW